MNTFTDWTLEEILLAVPELGKKKLADLFAKTERTDGLSNKMTLGEFYRRCYLPEISLPKGLDPNTIQQRSQAIRLWETLTPDPALAEIDKRIMGEFVIRLRELPAQGRVGKRISPATVRKHCRAIQSVLDHAGPKTGKNRDAKELVPMPPAFPPVKVFLNPTAKTPSREELAAILNACRVAEYPILPRISAPEWWKNAYRLLALTGMRKGDLLGLQWQFIRIIEGQPMFVIPAEIEKTGVEKIIPISTAARAVIDEMPRRGPADPIFPFPHGKTTFTRTRMKIVALSGVPPERATWHAVRRFVATVVRDAQLVLGHTTSSVTVRHYQSITRAADALEELIDIFDAK